MESSQAVMNAREEGNSDRMTLAEAPSDRVVQEGCSGLRTEW